VHFASRHLAPQQRERRQRRQWQRVSPSPVLIAFRTASGGASISIRGSAVGGSLSHFHQD
jgi:hypothetical protein